MVNYLCTSRRFCAIVELSPRRRAGRTAKRNRRDDIYLQAAQAELWEAVRGRKEVAETDCTEVGLVEKTKAAAEEKVNKEKMIYKNGGVLFGAD